MAGLVSNVCYLLDSTIADDTDLMEEHASVKQLQQSSEQGGAVTLEECFQVEWWMTTELFAFINFYPNRL